MPITKSQPLTYQQMVDIMNSRDWSKAYRYPAVQKAYNRHKRILAKANVSTSQYIDDMLNGREHLITFNGFGYNFEGIHCLGWWKPSRYDIINDAQTVQQALGEAIQEVFNGFTYNVAENPNKHLRSVPNVRHYHIAVKYDYNKFNQWDLIAYRIRNKYDFDVISELRKFN